MAEQFSYERNKASLALSITDNCIEVASSNGNSGQRMIWTIQNRKTLGKFRFFAVELWFFAVEYLVLYGSRLLGVQKEKI
ncbi:MAG: hypothetical protein COA78_23600 [Blastopirellula sp.]|nr:MAG: hypothetical protein COA78_23600 [Blastopirellula sp.]